MKAKKKKHRQKKLIKSKNEFIHFQNSFSTTTTKEKKRQIKFGDRFINVMQLYNQ